MSWRHLFAWLGERFPSRHPSRPALRRCHVRPCLEELEYRLTPSLSPVPDTTTYPYSAVVRIEAHFAGLPSGAYVLGTGALVDPYHVLTAGHILYDSADGGWADQVRVVPAQQGPDGQPFGDAYATLERTYQGFIDRDQAGTYDEHGDVGLLTLDRPVGNTAGWFTLGSSAGRPWEGLPVSTAGYPAEGAGHTGDRMFREDGVLGGISADGGVLNWSLSSIQSIPGQSGSPVWVHDPFQNRTILVGMVSSAADAQNIGYGARITPAILADLTTWMSQDAFPTAAAQPGLNRLAALGVTRGAADGVGVGAYDPATATWYLRSAETSGPPDAGTFVYGAPGWVPLTGDWNGDGRTGIGAYDPATATWYLRNGTSAGAPDAGTFAYGMPGWVPVVGDWNGDGKPGIGAFDPATGTWYLRNELSGGAPDAGVFTFGLPGWAPVVGDWSGAGWTGIGAFDPATATWYLRNEAGAGAPDAGAFRYGGPGWRPVTGRWDGTGHDAIGVVDPATLTWYLRSDDTAAPVPPFSFGAAAWVALTGNWIGPEHA